MLEHPGIELQLLIKEKGLTQKAFASILGKKVSEVNELLKGKRNITIQRDYLLHQTLGTPIKYWILKQIDYDYSLLDIEESEDLSSGTESKESISHETSHSEHSKESKNNNLSSGTMVKDIKGETHTHSKHNEESKEIPSSNKKDLKHLDSSPHKGISDSHTKEKQIIKPKSQENQKKEPENKAKDDHKKRANIFKSF